MRPWQKLVFSACTVLLFFVLLEAGLRLLYRPNRPFRWTAPHSLSVVEHDPDLGYRLKPNFKGNAYATSLQTNSLGFRGPEFDPKLKNGLRVVALGDSCTFGFGVSDNEHTYPAQLSKLLNDGYGKAEVINAGMVGYTSHQALRLLQKEIAGFHPDILLIYIGWNDLGLSLLPDWTPTMTQDVESDDIFRNSPSYVILFLSDVISRFRPKPKMVFKPEAIKVYSQNIGEIIDVSRQNQIEPVLITWPTRVFRQIDKIRNNEIMPGTGLNFDSFFDYYRKYQRELENVARQKDVRIIPLAEKMNPKDETYYFDEIHLSDLGAMEAAKVIFESLKDFLPNGEKLH